MHESCIQCLLRKVIHCFHGYELLFLKITLVWLGLPLRSHCVVLWFVHISTSLAQIEFSFISGINTLNFKKSCVLFLVLETLLIARKDGLAPKPPRHVCLLEVLFKADLGTHSLIVRGPEPLISTPPSCSPSPWNL